MATNVTTLSLESARQIAERVRAACIQTCIEAYDQAASDGLCAEGAWEVALEQLRILDLEHLVRAQIPRDTQEAQP